MKRAPLKVRSKKAELRKILFTALCLSISSFLILPSSFSSVPGDCAIIATEAYHRVAPAASWARLLHIDYVEPGALGDRALPGGHMVLAWQVVPNDPILVYDIYFLGGATLELQTARRDADTIAAHSADAINRQQHGTPLTISGAHFVE